MGYHNGITDEHAATVDSFIAWRANRWFSDDRIIDMAGIPFVRKWAEDCRQAMDQEGSPRVIVCGGHDISILPLLHSLTVPKTRLHLPWPDYASDIELTLWEEADGYLSVEVSSSVVDVRGAICDQTLETTLEDAGVNFFHSYGRGPSPPLSDGFIH